MEKHIFFSSVTESINYPSHSVFIITQILIVLQVPFWVWYLSSIIRKHQCNYLIATKINKSVNYLNHLRFLNFILEFHSKISQRRPYTVSDHSCGAFRGDPKWHIVSPCLGGGCWCFTAPLAVGLPVAWRAGASRLSVSRERSASLGSGVQGGDGGLGRLLRVTPQLQDREICHRGKPENRDIVSTVSAGRAGIHHRVSFMRATKAPFFRHGIKQPFKNGFTKLKIVKLPKCVEGFFFTVKVTVP